MPPRRPNLRAVTPTARAVAFCSHCGRPPAVPPAPAAPRVCRRCGLGLLLEAAPGAAPGPDEPFLIVDDSLAVCAVSRQAERLLGVAETEAVHRHVTAFVTPADHRAAVPFNVVALLERAARGAEEPRRVVVRPAGTFGVRWWARVATCEAPTAALLVITGPA